MFCCGACPSWAQRSVIDPGTLIVDGDAGISGHSASGLKARSLSLSPRLGVFVIRRLAVSAVLTSRYSSTDQDVGVTLGLGESVLTRAHASSTTWGVGPEVTYYFASVGSRTHLYGAFHSWFSWQSRSTRIEIPDRGVQESESSSEAINVSPRVGVLFLLVPNIGLNGSLYVTRSWDTRKLSSPLVDEATEAATSYGVAVGVSAFIR